MKSKGRHPHKALSAVKVNSLKTPGRYADGNGLYLVVQPSGAKHWVLRTIVHNRRTDIGLGGVSLVTLAEARDKATALRKIARDGGDPIAERRKGRSSAPTFKQAAIAVHAAHTPNWKNEKHAAQWISTLEEYAFPVFGSSRIDQISSADVLRALSPIWLTKPETARRVRQRIGVVFDWAKVAHGITNNPVDSVAQGLPKQKDNAVHHAALPYADVAGFLEKLRSAEAGASVKLAFEFLILTATRTSEVLLATWDEVDEASATWTIPAERMKAKREHRVPLSPQALEILKRARKLSDGGLVFLGRTPKKPMSNMVFLMLLRRMGVDTTAHGFRSSFRDWTSEQTNYPRDVCEMALAHVVKDKTEAAYRRGDLFEKRRRLMNDWAKWCANPLQSADVVPLRVKY